MSIAIANLALSAINFFNSRSNSASIKILEARLKFITDDVSWLSSTDSSKLVNEITKLKVKYESELAILNEEILNSNKFNNDINDLVNVMTSEFPEVFDFILDKELKLFELVTMTSSNLTQLYTVSEELALKIESVISSINAIAIKHGISLQDLSIRVDNNEKYIMVLSQKLLDLQTQLNYKFVGLKDELDYIQFEVNRQLIDIGLVSSNTTAVLLSDGSLKISDNLNLYTGRVFVGKASNITESGSTPAILPANGSHQASMNSNKSALSFNSAANGSTSWIHNTAIFSDTTKVKNIIPIEDDPGVLIDLSVSRDIIIPDITLDQPIFVILRGGGLANIDLSDIVPMFRPGHIKMANLNSRYTYTPRVPEVSPPYYYYGTSRGEFITAEATVGTPGTVIIPVTNQVSDYKQFLQVSTQSKSDTLIILKISKMVNWSTIINSATEKGGRLSGYMLASLDLVNMQGTNIQSKSGTGSAFSVLQPYEITQGDLILRFPQSHLTFHGIEVAF